MKEKTSDWDVRRLIQYLKSATPPPEEERWLREHLESAELRDGLQRLGKAVFPETFCAVCIDALPYYVHRELTTEDAEEKYPQVKAHLELCPRCAARYEDFHRMVADAYGDEIAPAPSYPDFDLSFLSQPAGAARLDWRQLWEEAASAGRRVHKLVSEVAISLKAPFEDLSASLRPALVAIPAPAQRHLGIATENVETIDVLDLRYPPANLLIRIGRGPVVAQSTVLAIDVLHTESMEPISATRVALYDARHRLMERLGTDPAGSARFEDVRVGRYFVQVLHADQTWEFPLSIDGSLGDV